MNLQTIARKIEKKIRNMFFTHVPWNTKYKPKGVTRISSSSTADVQYKEIYAAWNSVLTLDPQFIDDCSPHLKPTLSVAYPPDCLIIVKHARLVASDSNNVAVVSVDNLLIEEVSIQWGDDRMLAGNENLIFRRKGFTSPRKIPGTVFSLLSNGDPKDYYYHWVFDLMPKLFLLKQSGHADSVSHYLVPNYVHKYQQEYLDYFGITKDKVISEETAPHIQADVIIFCSAIRRANHHPKWACDFLHNSFARSYSSAKRAKRIYIARGDAALYRQVLNETELIEALKLIGVETYFLSRLSVPEQAILLNSASLVIGVHGGGLTNLVYCESGTNVLEIFPDNYVRHRFYDLCQKRALVYNYLLAPHGDNHPNGQTLSLTADIAAIRDKIQSIQTS